MPTLKTIEERVIRREYDQLTKKLAAIYKTLHAAFEPCFDLESRGFPNRINVADYNALNTTAAGTAAFIKSAVLAGQEYYAGASGITIPQHPPEFEDLPQAIRDAIADKAISDFLASVENCADAVREE